jgi:tetratricopeptide (TPR) repeat protein
VLMGDYKRGIEEFQKAIHLDDSHAEAYLSLCMTYLANQDFDKAGVALERASLLEPNSPDVIFTRGFADLMENNLASAMQAFQKALRSACSRSSGMFLLAQAEIYGGRFQAALQTLATGIGEDQKSGAFANEAEKRLSRAQIYLLLGNLPAAADECRMIPKLDNDSIRMAQLGSIYARIGQITEAQELLTQVEQLGKDPVARSHADMLRGEIQLSAGQVNQAIQSFKAVKQSLNLPLEPLARAFSQAKQWQFARKEYASVCEQKAAMLFPASQSWFMGTWGQALFDAGQCSLKLGKIDEAKQYFRQYLWALDSADSSLPSLQEAKALLTGKRQPRS